MQRTLLALTSVVVALGGCVADSGDESIIVMKNVHAGENCLASNSDTEVGVARGTLDLLMPSGYVFVAQLKSRIVASTTDDKDQRTIFTTGANVDITFPGSTLFSASELAQLSASGLTRFKQPFVAPITPNGGIIDVPFVAFPEELVELIAAKVDLSKKYRLEALVTFTVRGKLANGDVSSQPYAYAVTIGNGVVVSVLGDCSSIGSASSVRTGYACNPGQDGVVDCCITNADTLMCPAVAPTTLR